MSTGTVPRRPGDGDAAALGAVADEQRVAARPRREPLGGDVQRLEEVRLAGPVRPRHEDEARLELAARAGRTTGRPRA